MRELHVPKHQIRDARVVDVDVDATSLAEGAARLRIDRFALTSNNVTYAAMGEGMLGYWDFFPAPDGFGKVPCWGFATVVASNAPDVAVGARFYGFYPVAESLDVLPTRAGPRGFTDGAPHRAAKAAIYNQYLNVAADPMYDVAFEPEQTLFRPLYATGWWAADCILASAPRTVVLSSASAKTALATAHRLRELGGATRVALTSAANEAYVRDTGLYDRTVTYDDLEGLAAPGPVGFIDFLGREAVVDAVHRKFGDALVRSLIIGATDRGDRAGGVQPPRAPLPGAKPEFFFAPMYAAARMKADPDLGAAMLRDLVAFYPESRALVAADVATGADAILASWARLVAGTVAPREGLVRGFV